MTHSHENTHQKPTPDQIRLLTAEILFGLGIDDVTKMPPGERYWLAGSLWMVAPNTPADVTGDAEDRVRAAMHAAIERTGLAFDDTGEAAHSIGTLLGFHQPTPCTWLRPGAFVFHSRIGARGRNVLVTRIDSDGIIHFAETKPMSVGAAHMLCREQGHNKNAAGLPCGACGLTLPDLAVVGEPCPNCERIRREKTMPGLMAQLGAKPESARELKLATGFITFIASTGGGYVQAETVLVHRATKRSFRVTTGGTYLGGQPCPIEEIDAFHPSLPPPGTVLNWDPPPCIGAEAVVMADPLPEATAPAGPMVTFDGIAFKVKTLKPGEDGAHRVMVVDMAKLGERGNAPATLTALVERFEAGVSGELETPLGSFRAMAMRWDIASHVTVTFLEDKATPSVSASSKEDPHDTRAMRLVEADGSLNLDVAREMLAEVAKAGVTLLGDAQKGESIMLTDGKLMTWLDATRKSLATLDAVLGPADAKKDDLTYRTVRLEIRDLAWQTAHDIIATVKENGRKDIKDAERLRAAYDMVRFVDR